MGRGVREIVEKGFLKWTILKSTVLDNVSYTPVNRFVGTFRLIWNVYRYYAMNWAEMTAQDRMCITRPNISCYLATQVILASEHR